LGDGVATALAADPVAMNVHTNAQRDGEISGDVVRA